MKKRKTNILCFKDKTLKKFSPRLEYHIEKLDIDKEVLVLFLRYQHYFHFVDFESLLMLIHVK